MRPGRRTAVAVIVIILAGVWGNASAAILTFEQTQLLNFDFSAFSFSPPFTGAIGVNIGTNFLPGEPVYGALPSSARGVYFEGFGHDFTVGGTAADLGITGGSGFTGYGLHVANWDNQPWEFSIFANLATGSYESSFLSLAGQDDSALKPGGSTDLFLAFDLGYTIAAGDRFGIHVKGKELDLTHFEVAPVSEPGTLVLLGMGLIGLAGWGRSRFRK